MGCPRVLNPDGIKCPVASCLERDWSRYEKTYCGSDDRRDGDGHGAPSFSHPCLIPDLAKPEAAIKNPRRKRAGY